MIVGFDFGTTNSLISVVQNDQIRDILDGDDGRPIPSVICYEGEETIVGRTARDRLDEVGVGVFGTTVRSPKFLLGQRLVDIGGVERSPIDIVGDVISHVKEKTLSSDNVDFEITQAVATIPITMNGERRRELREAFRQADISVVQFVHEPLAALYGYLRGHEDSENELRRLMNRYVLVVDWGGGTLDITLCLIQSTRISQIKNGGSERVGGDVFDKVVRDEIIRKVLDELKLPESELRDDARLKLLQDAEEKKIQLSSNASATFYRAGLFENSDDAFEYQMTKSEFERITRGLVNEGLHEITNLLERTGIQRSQISSCLVVGGMAALPAIRNDLLELFGAERVIIPSSSATLISQGAAWIAHDKRKLLLAKPVELEITRGSTLSIIRAGTELPNEGEIHEGSIDLFCADPTDGIVKMPIVTPRDLIDSPQSYDMRDSIGELNLKVDDKAPPLVERLKLEYKIDHNLILILTANSSQGGDAVSNNYFNLEFGLPLPSIQNRVFTGETLIVNSLALEGTGLRVRANSTNTQDKSVIPGDVLHKHFPRSFGRLPGEYQASQIQRLEHLYNEPCASCKEPWGSPKCKCSSK